MKNRIIQNKNEMNQNNREQLNHENRLTKLFEDFEDFKDLYSCYSRSIGPIRCHTWHNILYRIHKHVTFRHVMPFYEQILEWRAMLCKKVTIKNSLNRQIGLQDNLKWTLYRKTLFWICLSTNPFSILSLLAHDTVTPYSSN